MVTQDGANVGVCAVEGNFDDAQAGVKRIFSDEAIRPTLADRGYVPVLRQLHQLGPYPAPGGLLYLRLLRPGPGREAQHGRQGELLCATGNFGDILAAYYAKRMGLPVGKLICASNCNDVLTDFLRTGVYDKNRPFHTTMSPSMDILVSSNLERLLYYKSGKDADYIAQLMNELEATGRYQVREDIFTSVREDFAGGYCDDAACAQSMREFYEQSGYVMDPHTAIATR